MLGKSGIILSRFCMFTEISKKIRRDLRVVSAAKWEKRGEAMALALFHAAANAVPAYADFLKKNEINPKKIKTKDDFLKIPLTSKENYVERYPLDALCWGGRIDRGAVVAESSGTSGRHFLWPRFKEQEEESAVIHDILLRSIFGAEKKKTLFVVTFHLGAHIAGMIIADSIKRVLQAGLPGALVTPGLQKNDIIQLIQKLHPSFEQVVIAGYPPFLKDVVEDLLADGYNPSTHPLKLMCSGESFPEAWRDAILKKIKSSPTEGIFNVYGSADFAMMGHETPLTIALRRKAYKNSALAALLGGTTAHVPPLYQTYPTSRYFEEVDGELVCTAASGIPLVRYAIHDAGAVIPYEKIKSYLGMTIAPHWRLPIVAVYGRKNHTATIYALNVYPEHIQEIIAHSKINTFITGKFFLQTQYDAGHDQYLELHVELLPKRAHTKNLEVQLGAVVTAQLQKINLEYGKLYAAVGDKVSVRVVAHAFGDEGFRAIKMKHKYIVK